MTPFEALLSNRALTAPLLAWFIAQCIKFAAELLVRGTFNVRLFVSSGGMPSAHTALVTGLATAIGRTDGLSSSSFAIAALFAAIVMYDAAGVRRAVGIQARILNRMLEEYFTAQRFNEQRLRELVGHTPVQVVAGAVLGIATGWVVT